MNERDGPVPEGRESAPAEGFAARIAAQKWVLSAATLLALLGLFSPLGPGYSLLAWLAVVAAALAMPAGRRSRLSGSGREAAAQRQRQAVLDGARALAAGLPDPCLLLTPDGRVAYLNEAARAIFSAVAEDRPVTAFLRAPEFAAALADVRRDGRARTVTYFERVPVERRFEAFIAPLVPPGAAGAGLSVVLRDLTEQQRLERMRADFVANASHELRTPLASLIGFIETLQGAARDDEEARDRFLDIMRAQARRMSRLVDELLSLSRIELSAHVRPTARIDLVAVVGHVVEALTPLATGAGVEIRFAAPAAPVVVAGDRDELAQVFQNLIENAIKYGQSGGRVDVSVELSGAAPGRRAGVAVRDYGPGIAEEHIPRLTERFYRVDATASREKGGTGLGLAIVKHILNRHGGALKIRSRPGEGATFTVLLDPVGEEGTVPEDAPATARTDR